MKFQWVRRLTARVLPASPAAHQPVPAATPAGTNRSFLYPPADTGLSVLPADAILAANHELITRLHLHAATDAEQFERRFKAPLRRLAAHVNTLPATSSGLFAGEMGLFRASLELAFYAFQASDGRIFTGSEGVERRHALETRWRYLCFLAGLFYPLGRSLELMAVTGPDGKVWKRHFGGVTEWTEAAGLDRVFVAWGGGQQEDNLGPSHAAVALVPAIVGADNLQMLQDGEGDLVSALYALAAGEQGPSRLAYQVISGTWERITRREAARRPQAFGRLTSGTHQGPYLIGAIRALMDAGTWKLNESCLRVDGGGLYLLWPEGAKDLIAFGRSQGYAGWADDSPTLAALLRAAEIIDSDAGDMGIVEVVADGGEIRAALKFANPLAVLDEYDPSQFAKKAPAALEAVLKADPLAAAEARAGEPVPPKQKPRRRANSAGAPELPLAAQSLDTQAELEPEDEDSDEPTGTQGDLVENHEKPKPQQHQEPGTPSLNQMAAPSAKPERLHEAAEVRYADLVPEDIRNEIANALQVERLGKVVKAWRERGENSDSMRRIDHGAAISFKFLSGHINDVPNWVEALARTGLIYSPRSTPGLRIQKIAIPEGKGEVQAVVLSNLACKRLGL